VSQEKPTVEVQTISCHGQSLFVVRRKQDRPWLPYVSVQLPTDIAEWLAGLCEAAEKGPAEPPARKPLALTTGEMLCHRAAKLGWKPSPLDRSYSSPSNQNSAKVYLAALGQKR
jgi:hypothetical protein